MTPFCLDLIVAINNCWNFWLFSIRQLWARRRFDVFVCLLSWWHSVQGSSTASVLLLSQISSFGWALVPRLRPICGSRGPFSRDSMLFFALRRPISRFRWRVLDLLRRCRCLLRFWRFFFLFFPFFFNEDWMGFSGFMGHSGHYFPFIQLVFKEIPCQISSVTAGESRALECNANTDWIQRWNKRRWSRSSNETIEWGNCPSGNGWCRALKWSNDDRPVHRHQPNNKRPLQSGFIPKYETDQWTGQTDT